MFFGRFDGVLRAMVPTIVGLSRMPYRTFLPWNAAGGVIWAPGFVLLGYLAGGSYHQVSRWVWRASVVLLAMAVVSVALVAAARSASRHEPALRAWARRQGDRPLVAGLRPRFERQLGFAVRRLRPGGAFGLSLTLGLGMLAVVGWSFGAVLQDVVARDELASVDGSVYRFFLGHRSTTLASASRVATFLASAPVLAALAIGAGIVAWRRTGRRSDLSLAPLALAGSAGINAAVKLVIQRPRPPLAGAVGSASGYSFPSAHATTRTACYLALAITAFAFVCSWRGRVATVAAAVGLTLVVGLSSLTLGLQWITDVLGGWALGILWLAVIMVSGSLAGDVRRRPGPNDPAERDRTEPVKG